MTLCEQHELHNKEMLKGMKNKAYLFTCDETLYLPHLSQTFDLFCPFLYLKENNLIDCNNHTFFSIQSSWKNVITTIKINKLSPTNVASVFFHYFTYKADTA